MKREIEKNAALAPISPISCGSGTDFVVPISLVQEKRRGQS